MKLSIVILNYNVSNFLQLCLESVEATITNIEAEIIVVDNNSSDNSCEMVKKVFPKVKLIENKNNDGFSKGNNIGVAQAKGEYVCILNPDTVVAEDTFEQLLEFADSKTDLGIVGCKLIDGRGQFLPESKRNIPLVRVAFQKMIGNPKAYYANHLNEDEVGKADILVGAFMLMKKDIYDRVGGFDEDYFMYGEDIDLSYKVLNTGFTNYYYGKTTIIHYKGESTLKDKIYAKRFYGAMQLFYQKHFRKNIIFDGLVWLGVKLAFIMRHVPNKKEVNIEQYIFISNKANKALQEVYPLLKTQEDLNNLQQDSQIIFNAENVSYKQIVDYMSDAQIHSKATFRILLKKGIFVIGSDTSKHRGEVKFL